MSKFYVGQKVRVTGNSYYDDDRGGECVGEVCEVRSSLGVPDVYGIYTPDKTDYWYFKPSDLEPITETPDEITLNGVTYVLKEDRKPEHEWKFGDWARHPEYGVVFVGNVNGPDELWCVLKDSSGWHSGQHINPNELTYISSSDIPE